MALACSLLVLLCVAAEINGYCYLTKAVSVRLPVYCEKGEYCCGSGRYRHCCNEDNSYAPLAVGLGVGIPVTLAVAGLIIFLCVKGKLRCPVQRSSDRSVNYAPAKSGEAS
ncbi:uncharacterized protein LOC124272286 [Haliotis rubra]|uniref:uncharacterized protein LOC124272286 n=1 Tax=Haliotis rubra TaxID=36100 RepID=UPI001EE5D35D|nr:uncharacterized protein LOC124272286 [Haliotis rubra]